ncbi:hypothetical protein Tco_0787493 [Tanacetum coccineum]
MNDSWSCEQLAQDLACENNNESSGEEEEDEQRTGGDDDYSDDDDDYFIVAWILLNGIVTFSTFSDLLLYRIVDLPNSGFVEM